MRARGHEVACGRTTHRTRRLMRPESVRYLPRLLLDDVEQAGSIVRSPATRGTKRRPSAAGDEVTGSALLNVTGTAASPKTAVRACASARWFSCALMPEGSGGRSRQ